MKRSVRGAIVAFRSAKGAFPVMKTAMKRSVRERTATCRSRPSRFRLRSTSSTSNTMSGCPPGPRRVRRRVGSAESAARWKMTHGAAPLPCRSARCCRIRSRRQFRSNRWHRDRPQEPRRHTSQRETEHQPMSARCGAIVVLRETHGGIQTPEDRLLLRFGGQVVAPISDLIDGARHEIFSAASIWLPPVT